jgi:hypothetical protein
LPVVVGRQWAVLGALALLCARTPARLHAQQDPPAIAPVPPSPESVLGFRVGQDSMLASWRQIGEYFTRLAAASPMVRVDTLGPSTLGRPYLFVTITDPANHDRRAAILEGQRRLADPRALPAAEEAALVARQPAVILISASIHATEIAASQMSMELAWRLVTDTALAAALRDVVVLLVPSANPDGVDIVGDWYRAQRGTPYDGTAPPWLYHPYVGHDNNRDWFMLTQVETRMLTRALYRTWFPEVVYDVHQMGSNGARMFVPPFADPVNPNLDPAVVAGMNLVGTAMASALLDAGKTGVAHQARYDLWWHGGARSVPTRHNMVGILSEAASARIASPNCATASVRQPERGVSYPAPWTQGCWRLRDIVDYELIAAEALVRLARDQRAAFVRRFVAANRRAVEEGRRAAPYAFVLPADSGDAGARAHLANLLLAAGVEVHRATAPLRNGDRTWPTGSLIVRMDQPFRSHAKDLLERQDYPDRRQYPRGPLIPPYDVSGWTLPLQMGVPAERLDQPLGEAALERLDTVLVPAGGIAGRGDIVLLDNRANAMITGVWRALAAGARVEFAPRGFRAEGRAYPAGTLVVRGGRAALDSAARRLGFTGTAVRATDLPAGPAVRGVPRVALYRSWNASMDEGWTRWVLEQLGVPFTGVNDSVMRAGGLRERFDVVILPSETETAIADGRPANLVPARYAGGLGSAGIEALRTFLAEGGTIIALDQASRFAIGRLNAPAQALRVISAGGDPADRGGEPAGSGENVSRFSAPGSIFEAIVDQTHPVTSGMGPSAAVYFIASTILEAGPGARALLTYPADRSPLLSGYLEGASFVQGKAALVDAPVGAGRVLLFGFRPQHRGQTHGTFRLLTNAILYGAAAAPAPTRGAGSNATGR